LIEKGELEEMKPRNKPNYWTPLQKDEFVQFIKTYGKDYKKIS
jgi:hypothetical protein